VRLGGLSASVPNHPVCYKPTDDVGVRLVRRYHYLHAKRGITGEQTTVRREDVGRIHTRKLLVRLTPRMYDSERRENAVSV
jgi:hypothetical protein